RGADERPGDVALVGHRRGSRGGGRGRGRGGGARSHRHRRGGGRGHGHRRRGGHGGGLGERARAEGEREQAEDEGEKEFVHGVLFCSWPQRASLPVSPVRMRTTCSSAETKTFPSPIFPVRAAASIASMTRSTIASSTAASIFTFGR